MSGGTLFNCFTNYAEDAILTYVAGLFTPYLALFSVQPTQSTTGTEISTGAYARQSFTWSAPGLNPQGNYYIYNTAAITFPNPTANYTVVGCGVCDAVTSGHQWLVGALVNSLNIPTPVSVTNGGTPIVIPAGAIIVNLT